VTELINQKKLRWPAFEEVCLVPLQLPSTHRHATVFNAAQVPSVPGVGNHPYFLADGMGDAAHDSSSSRLLVMSSNNPVIIYAPSGSGKTRALMQLLWSHFGTFLVFKKPEGASKNFGSIDLGGLTNMLIARVVRFSPEEKRSYAEFGMRCILRIRLAVREAWEASVRGALTPAQWLLGQLHPSEFFGCDIFALVLWKILASCSESSVAGVHPNRYLTVVDEAQLLMGALAGQIPSTRDGATGQAHPGRSLLSPLMAAVKFFEGNLIIAGTGLSMLGVFESADSRFAAASHSDLVFSDFPFFTEQDVLGFLTRVLQTSAANDNLVDACAWLCGRPRLVTKFVERAIAVPTASLWNLLSDFVQMMTALEGDLTTPGGLVRKMEESSSLGNPALTFYDPYSSRTPVTIKAVFEAFKWAAWNEINGAVGSVSYVRSLALVEVGVAKAPTESRELVDIHLEPLVRQAVRKRLFGDSVQLEDEMTRVRSEASSLGFVFERSVPVVVIPSLFKISEPFESNALFEGFDFPPEFCGCWRPCLSRYGRIAEPGGDLLGWFKSACAAQDDARREIPAGLYPHEDAGPDFACLVERVTAQQASPGWVLSTPRAVALVLVQTKLAKSIVASKAALTVDPELVYHVRRGSSNPQLNGATAAERRMFLENVRSMPVIRVVVSAAEDVEEARMPLLQLVEHGRPGSPFPVDLLVAVRGVKRVRELFGDKFTRLLQELKGKPVKGEII